MIISKYEMKDQVITLETGRLVNSNIVYFFIKFKKNNIDEEIIVFRTFILDDALKHYLSQIKMNIKYNLTNDYRTKTEEEL